MFTQEESVEAHALAARGWSISAIARHLGRDRKTIRAHINKHRDPGARSRAADPFGGFEPYLRQRFADDPHVRARVLMRELVPLGFAASYQTLTREVRIRGLRPHCEACAGVKGRATIEIAHDPGDETQWDYLELPETPWGCAATVLVGVLAHSGRFRARFVERSDTPHLIEATDLVARALGGLTRGWRIDHMSGAVIPATKRLVPAFADAAKHLGVEIRICPSRRANRKGVVESAIDYITQSWWRTADVADPEQAQVSLDVFSVFVADERDRDGMTVAERAATEPLRPMPEQPHPATIEVERSVTWAALVSFEGNRYSVPPQFVNARVSVRARLGDATIEIRSRSGTVIARHRRQPRGAGVCARTNEHRQALEGAVLEQFTTAPPCRRKPNRPPSEAARGIARILREEAAPVTVDLARYAELVAP
ncbi:MAG: Mu transposase domain-containing protein [Actinomycetota bacterium]